MYLYRMQDTSNMLARWAIALRNFDFTVKHIPGKLDALPDTLSRLFPKLVRHEPAMVSICRNVPDDKPYHRSRPRDFDISNQSLELQPVQNDRKKISNAVSVFPLVAPEALIKLRKKEFEEYFKFLTSPTDSSTVVPSGENPNNMSHFFLHENTLLGHFLCC